LPGSQDPQGNFTPTGIAVGLGTRVQSTQTDFSQGSFQQTDSPLDVAINGRGFFQVLDPFTGQMLYTREGDWSINSNYQLVIGSAQTGYIVQPPITVPQDMTNIVIGADGKVQVQQYNNLNYTIVGQLQLANFINPEGLFKLGQNLFQQTDSSGPPLQANPGQNGIGTLLQSTLELSNVDPVNELVNLITTQRSFEMNSQAVQAADQIMQLITNLRRY
jgi:flagellar basal-body rod protein FlgG